MVIKYQNSVESEMLRIRQKKRKNSVEMGNFDKTTAPFSEFPSLNKESLNQVVLRHFS